MVRERQTDNREKERGDEEGQEKKMRHILDYNNKNFLIYVSIYLIYLMHD